MPDWIARFAARLSRPADTPMMLCWAALAGFAGALATIAFREGLAGLQWLLVGHSGSLVEMARSLPWTARLALPALGGVVAGAVLLLARRYTNDSTADYMEATGEGDGHISVRQTLLRSVSSLCTIASGGSIGREGAMIQLAAMCASTLGRITRLSRTQLRLLVACGAAAGITSAYNAPIASAFFIAEIVLGAIMMESVGPIMIAAVIANITMRDLPGYHATYEMPVLPVVSNLEALLFLCLGAVAGLAAPQFLRLLGRVRQAFGASALPLPLRLGLGGLLVGAISIWVPQVWGNGYSVVNALLHQSWAWQVVLLILVCKVMATAFTVGSGAVGGVFTPALFVGAALGHLYGQGMQALLPGLVSAPFLYTIVGMGAFLAASTSAPLMAMLMIFEMTASYEIMLPLMLACVVAYFVARRQSSLFMYDIVTRRDLDAQRRARLRETRMRDLVRPAETVLPMDASLTEMRQMFAAHRVKYLYLVDAQQRFQGVASLHALTEFLSGPQAGERRVAGDFVQASLLPRIKPSMSLEQALGHFLQHQGERLPMVQSDEDPVLLGAVYKTSLLQAYVQLNRSQQLSGETPH